MFDQQKSVPLYKRWKLLLAVPVALIIVVALLWGFNAWRRSRTNEAQYDRVEQHRQQQAAQAQTTAAAAATTASPVAQPSASASPAAGGATQPTTTASRNYWTNYRGPRRDGKYDQAIATSWPANGLPMLWKQPIGIGFSSFVIADGRAFTIEQRRKQEVVAAYDVATGRELWTQAWDAEFSEEQGDGPRSTPTWDQGRLYALGATGEFRCLDANTGAVIWGKNILAENQASNLPWAQSASPLIVDDKVIVQPGGGGGKSVVAYNKMTGAPVWKALDDRQAYVSPMLVELGGRRQIMVVSALRVVGLAPENGSLLWSYTWDTDMGINCSQPIIVDKNRFFISSGYDKGAAVVELKPNGNTFTATTVWQNKNMKNRFNSSVLYNGYIYGLDEKILACVDVNTGERKWKEGRFGFGQVLLASGHLVITSGETGEVVLVKASPDKYTEIARFAAIQGTTWNYPAIADGRLLVRNSSEMAAYDISKR
jgi:outer membrane protein assembly factor BamB